MHDHAALLDLHLLAVEFYFNHGSLFRDQPRAPAGMISLPSEVGRFGRTILASNSCRKCLIIARTGIAAASPSAQMVRPWMLSATELSNSMSLGLPWPL